MIHFGALIRWNERFSVSFKKAKVLEEENPSEKGGVVRLGLGQSMKNCE